MLVELTEVPQCFFRPVRHICAASRKLGWLPAMQGMNVVAPTTRRSAQALLHYSTTSKTSHARFFHARRISCFYGFTWKSFAISLDVGLTPMSTKRFTMLFRRTKLELPTFSKRLGRLCTIPLNRSLSRIRYVHWPMLGNELLMHLEDCSRSLLNIGWHWRTTIHLPNMNGARAT